jgi:hypothetical protein
LLIPFSGASQSDKCKDAYNFYLLQLQIQIEMSFGRMTARWRLFHHNLDCSFPLCTSIILVSGLLHNGPAVIINRTIGNRDEIVFNPTDNHTQTEQTVSTSQATFDWKYNDKTSTFAGGD